MNPATTVRPNILLIHVDQHRHDCIAANGHPCAVTPHLDRMAAAGVNFRVACCPAPICTPARTSLLTGVYATQHGCLANRGTEAYRPMDPQLPTFSQVANWLRFASAVMTCRRRYRLGGACGSSRVFRIGRRFVV